MQRKFQFSFFVIIVLLNSVAAGAWAQDVPTLTTNAGTSAPALAKSKGKLSFRLAALASSASLRSASAVDQARALSVASHGPGSLMRDPQGRLLVYIRMTDLSTDQLQALRATGAVITNVSNRYRTVTALTNATNLTAIANLATVQSVQEELTPETSSAAPIATYLLSKQQRTGAHTPLATCPGGSVVTEGDTQLNAAAARSTYSLDGTGVTVGVLSDSFDQDTSAVTHASDDITTGDLPGASNPCGYLTATNVISTYIYSGPNDEGRAMLQIVHDLAPSANLEFASAFNGIFAFADNIRNLRGAGADIIGDDIFYYADPFFQDGPVSVAISDVVASGALYFSLAGNHNIIVGGNNVSSYEAPAYRPVACPLVIYNGIPETLSGDCHDFDPSSIVNNKSGIYLQNGGSVLVDFQYNEPWYGVTDDFDIYLLDNSNNIVAYSYANNLVTEQPFEIFYYQNNTGSPQVYWIVVNRYSGSDAPRFKYIFTQGTYGLLSVQYSVSSGGDIVGPTLYGHSANRYGFSVAAVPYSDSTTPEAYTSRGPAAHYFGPVSSSSPAAPISPDYIPQPNFGATDGGCSTFFGEYDAGVPCYRFYGTSAATPHAMAVTTLLKQRANQLHVPLSASATRFLLQSTAQPVSHGDVNSVGVGLINALAAIEQLPNLGRSFLPIILR